jgi:hypothetical protein
LRRASSFARNLGITSVPARRAARTRPEGWDLFRVGGGFYRSPSPGGTGDAQVDHAWLPSLFGFGLRFYKRHEFAALQ